MISIEIPHTGTKLYMPEDLSECDTRQYYELSMLIYQLQTQQMSYEVFRVHAVYALLNMKPVEDDDAGAQEDKMANIYKLSELVDDFFEDGEGDIRILKQYYVHNPIAKIKLLGSNYYGPADGFENIQFGEYIDALHLFSEFNATNDNECLYQLMATLYRRPKSIFKIGVSNEDINGDARKAYNQHGVDDRAKHFKNLYFGQLYGFYLLFASFQKYIASAKIYWQGRELDLSILFEADPESKQSDVPGIGMKSILFTLAESGVFGSKKELEKENLWEILMRMYDLTKRDKDFKVQQDALKTKS